MDTIPLTTMGTRKRLAMITKRRAPHPFLLVGLMSILSAACLLLRLTPSQETPEPTFPPAQNFEFTTISDLKEKRPDSGSFDIEGYVAKIFSCPPCPAGAACMPCMEENIVISERAVTVEAYTALTRSELILFVQNPERLFMIGEKYQFSIRVRDERTTDEPINDLELVGYSP